MVLDDHIEAIVHILHMFSWIGQAIIVVQTHIHEKVFLGESSIQCVWTREKPFTNWDYKHSPEVCSFS